jgi:GNAT superfamily N-acetyltransferase
MTDKILSGPLEIAPLTSQRWDDFTALFGGSAVTNGCWCMFWRIPRKQFQNNGSAGNRTAMQALVDAGEIPGVLAYLDGQPVAWCSLGPRESYGALERSRVLTRVDEQPVWSLVCFFVAKGHRHQGLMLPLLRGALEYARAQGARLVEAYPIEHTTFDVAGSYMGRIATLEQAGFTIVAAPNARRRIMRCELQ